MQNLSLRDNFLHFEPMTVFSFSGHFLTVNIDLYLYHDNEPVQGQIRWRLQPLKKHIDVINKKNCFEISGDVIFVGEFVARN